MGDRCELVHNRRPAEDAPSRTATLAGRRGLDFCQCGRHSDHVGGAAVGSANRAKYIVHQTNTSLQFNAAYTGNDPQIASLADVQGIDLAAQATVLGVSETPASPPSLPPPEQLADLNAGQAPPLALLDVPRNRQDRNLNCELRSATDLALFYGWDFTWEEFFETVGIDPAGDPNVGFVGRSMNDPVGGIYPAGYGVYAEPVAKGLRRLGVPPRHIRVRTSIG